MQFHKWFLVTVFKENKWLFGIFSIFILFGIYFNYKGIETTPFFIYAMYAGKEEPQSHYRITTIIYNDNQPVNIRHTWQEPMSMMLYYTLNHYRRIEKNNMTDPMYGSIFNTVLPKYPFLYPVSGRLINQPADIALYFPWFKKYLQSIVHVPIKRIFIFEKTIHYQPDGTVVADSSKLLYSIK